jgi:hypothetical protein
MKIAQATTQKFVCSLGRLRPRSLRGSTGLQASLLALLFRIQIRHLEVSHQTFHSNERFDDWWLVATTISEVFVW